MEPIYFNKIEYTETLRGWEPRRSRILLNIPGKELSYQVNEIIYKRGSIPSIKIQKFGDYTDIGTVLVPVKLVKSGKNDFAGKVFMEENQDEDVVFSYAEKLNDKQMEELLPYCNALDFEPYRGKEMSMKDKGFIGYRDEISLSFKATTDSYIPFLELPMNYYYDEAHIWPSEKLYRYLMKTFFSDRSKFKNYVIPYSGASLFGI